MRLAKFAGRFALFLTGMALLTVVSLFVVGAFLTTWPVHRISPRNQRLTAIMELATALFGTARAFNFTPSPPEATEATEATESFPGLPTEAVLDFLNWAREERGSYLEAGGNPLEAAEVISLLTEFLHKREGGD